MRPVGAGSSRWYSDKAESAEKEETAGKAETAEQEGGPRTASQEAGPQDSSGSDGTPDPTAELKATLEAKEKEIVTWKVSNRGALSKIPCSG